MEACTPAMGVVGGTPPAIVEIVYCCAQPKEPHPSSNKLKVVRFLNAIDPSPGFRLSRISHERRAIFFASLYSDRNPNERIMGSERIENEKDLTPLVGKREGRQI